MRTIKYRAKIQGHNGFVYGVPHNVYSDPGHKYQWFDSIQYMDDEGRPQVEYIEANTLSEYTGLQDRNGVEMYEGDLIKDQWGQIYTVVFEQGSFYGKYKDPEADADINIYHEESILEVVRNIHNNPELLGI